MTPAAIVIAYDRLILNTTDVDYYVASTTSRSASSRARPCSTG